MTDQQKVLERFPTAMCLYRLDENKGVNGWQVYDRGQSGLLWNVLSRFCSSEELAWKDTRERWTVRDYSE